MEFLIYDYDKNYLGNDNFRKKQLKKERLSYECLYEFFKETELNDDYYYFLTSYKKKQTYSLKVKFYLRRKTKHLTFDDTHTIEVLHVNFSLDGKEHNYLKKYPKNEVIGIKRTEDTNIVCFYVVVKDQSIKPITTTLETECQVCYEINKNTLQTGFFCCNHKELCIDCYDGLISKKCPICRSH